MAGFLAGNRRGAMSELVQTLPFRGRRSRNKVSVGEPAEGSLTQISKNRESKSWIKAFEVTRKRDLELQLLFPRHQQRIVEVLNNLLSLKRQYKANH